MRAEPGWRTDKAAQLMQGFAERTGLSAGEERRYLWTDAFAVCNYLGLAQLTHDARFRELSLSLVDQVHHTLGQHRPDDARRGWLSGLPEGQAEKHPTCGGLRIGKKLPERAEDEPFDRELEWDRDGQYFHYLVQWMHALNQASLSTSEPQLNLWARELAHTVLDRFRSASTDHLHLAWKLSIDLSRPLVRSMGQHDALDGFVTFAELRTASRSFTKNPAEPDLTPELEALAPLLDASDWATTDPLGLGGLLIDACRVAQLMQRGAFSDDRLLCALLAVALGGLEHYAQIAELAEPSGTRLAFRELGLSIGLAALERIDGELRPPLRFSRPELAVLLEALRPYVALGPLIESFWLDAQNETSELWSEHRDINEVMLATRLVPEGFLAYPS